MKRRCVYLVTLLCAALADPREDETCDNEQLVRCAYPMNKELVFVGGKEELDSWCPELKNGIMCIENYTRRCMSAQQREHFHQLYAGTSSVIQELCQEGPYQQEFLRHAPCMREMKSHYEYCAKAYQRKMQEMSSNESLPQPDESVQIRMVCCSFQNYLQCSQTIVREKCGMETATFTEGFLDRMSSNLMEVHCGKHVIQGESCEGFNSAGCLISSSRTMFLLSVIFLRIVKSLNLT